MIEEETQASLQKYKRESDKLYQEQVGKFEDFMEQKLKNKLSGFTQKSDELKKLLEEESETSLQNFKRKSEELCKEKEAEFEDQMEQKLENKLSGFTQKLDELHKLSEEKSKASLQNFERKSEEIYKEIVGKLEDTMEEKLKNKLTDLNKTSYKIEHFDLNFLAFIIFCMFAIFSYVIYSCSDSCSDLESIKELAKVFTTKTVEYFN